MKTLLIMLALFITCNGYAQRFGIACAVYHGDKPCPGFENLTQADTIPDYSLKVAPLIFAYPLTTYDKITKLEKRIEELESLVLKLQNSILPGYSVDPGFYPLQPIGSIDTSMLISDYKRLIDNYYYSEHYWYDDHAPTIKILKKGKKNK